MNNLFTTFSVIDSLCYKNVDKISSIIVDINCIGKFEYICKNCLFSENIIQKFKHLQLNSDIIIQFEHNKIKYNFSSYSSLTHSRFYKNCENFLISNCDVFDRKNILQYLNSEIFIKDNNSDILKIKTKNDYLCDKFFDKNIGLLKESEENKLFNVVNNLKEFRKKQINYNIVYID